MGRKGFAGSSKTEQNGRELEASVNEVLVFGLQWAWIIGKSMAASFGLVTLLVSSHLKVHFPKQVWWLKLTMTITHCYKGDGANVVVAT